MFGAGRRPQGVLTITVRFSNRYDPPLRISFDSYPDIWDRKEIGPTVSTVDDACFQLREWLDNFIERHERGDN